MSDQKIVVRIGGEVFEAPLTVGVMSAWEARFDRPYMATMGNPDALRLDHVLWLAWEALRRNGTVVKPFDQWKDTVDTFPQVEGTLEVGRGPLPEGQ